MSQRDEARKIAKMAFLEIERAMEKVRGEFPGYEFDFCWDECMWVDEEFFASKDAIFNGVDDEVDKC